MEWNLRYNLRRGMETEPRKKEMRQDERTIVRSFGVSEEE
jgi:hypothetical protein